MTITEEPSEVGQWTVGVVPDQWDWPGGEVGAGVSV